jgi:class 3 adenylate cyclase
VAFADLSGFTRLGHRLDARSVGRVARRLSAIAQEVCAPPVIMVKAVGDSVMLVWRHLRRSRSAPRRLRGVRGVVRVARLRTPPA